MAPQPDHIPPPKADFTAPPPYDAGDYTSVVPPPIEPSKLPTYEEVQLEKTLQGEPIQPQILPPSLCATGRPPHHTSNTGNVTFIAIADTTDPENITSDNSLLGTDIIFVTAFLIAFLFNWIGFLMLTCFCHTIAARYGALSGFGLSLAKWTLIVKHNTDLASHENSWLWWLIMAFGFLICVRALVQYVSTICFCTRAIIILLLSQRYPIVHLSWLHKQYNTTTINQTQKSVDQDFEIWI